MHDGCLACSGIEPGSIGPEADVLPARPRGPQIRQFCFKRKLHKQMGQCNDVTEWQKWTIVFERAHDHMVRDVAEFVGVSQWTIQRGYNQ